MTKFVFFIIECYSFDETVDFVLMPSHQILCTMVVIFFLEFIGNVGGSDQISHSHETLGNAKDSGKNCGSQSDLGGISDGKSRYLFFHC